MHKKRSILSKEVQKGKEVFIAPTATVLGEVILGDEVSIWFGAVMRGDSDKISIGNKSNVQDNAVIHCDPGYPAVIGEECIVGHGAVVHGAILENNVLIGMHATILNGARIGEFSIVGANALVTSNMNIEKGSLVLGSPAKVIRKLTEEEKKSIVLNAKSYVDLSKEYIQKY